MIAAINEGGNSAGLMQYLVGPGRANEHTRPHLVAGSDVIMRRWGSWEALSPAQGFEIARFVDQFMTETGTRPMGKRRVFNAQTGKREVIEGPVANHVWHCSLSLSPREAAQGDEQWQRIARDFADRMGFTGADGKAPCRWVAVHHGPAKNGGDHIHIMVNVVREDGTKWNRYQDQPKAMRACNKIEHAYGLEVVEAREHARGARADSAADLREAARRGRARTDREELEHRVRAAAVAARDEADFVRRLGEAGVRARPRFAEGRTDVVTGYSVALRTRGGGRPRWYSGGKVARDLSLSRLRSRWEDSPRSAQRAVDAWRRAWRGTPARRPLARAELDARALDAYTDALRGVDASDPVALADAARDVAGLLSAQALAADDARTGERLARAARAVGRAAQTHRRPAPAAGVNRAVSLAASLALTAAGGGASTTALAVQTLALVSVLADLHRAARQARTARDMLECSAAALAAVNRTPAGALQHVPGAARARGPAAPAGTAGTARPDPADRPGPPAGSGRPGRAPAGTGAEQARRIRTAAAATPPGPAPAPTTGRPAGRPSPGPTPQEAERIRRIMGLALAPRAAGGGAGNRGEPPQPPPTAPTRGRGRSL